MNERIIATCRPDKMGRYHKVKRNKHQAAKLTAMALLTILAYQAATATTQFDINVNAADAGLVETADKTAPSAEPSATPEAAADHRPMAAYPASGNPTLDEIIAIAEEHDFQWIGYLVKLTTCENREHIANKRNCIGNYPAGSCDRGVFQINDYWHAEVSDACADDIRCATEWTMQRIEAGYQHEWVCDSLIKSGQFKIN